jgi:hypothetical protein
MPGPALVLAGLEGEKGYTAGRKDRADEPAGTDLFLRDEGGEGGDDDDARLSYCGH